MRWRANVSTVATYGSVLVGAMTLLSVGIVAQAKPTDAQVTTLVKKVLQARVVDEMPVAIGGTREIKAVRVLRWGQYQAAKKSWPAEVCVTVKLSPAFATPHDEGAKMRFVFKVDDFGDPTAEYQEHVQNATAADMQCAPNGAPSRP